MKNNKKAAIISIVIFAVIVMVMAIAAASCEKILHNEQSETIPMASSQDDYWDRRRDMNEQKEAYENISSAQELKDYCDKYNAGYRFENKIDENGNGLTYITDDKYYFLYSKTNPVTGVVTIVE